MTYAEKEAVITARLKGLDAHVEKLWPDYSVQTIAKACAKHYRMPVTPKWVWSAKARGAGEKRRQERVDAVKVGQ